MAIRLHGMPDGAYGMNVARWICAALAVVACAWFAFGIRQATDTSRESAIANESNHVTAAQEHEVSSLAHGARLLNPDTQPDALLGQTEVEHGDLAAARRVLEPITRSEPQNVSVWLWLTRASAGGRNNALFYVAAVHLRQLEPHFPAP